MRTGLLRKILAVLLLAAFFGWAAWYVSNNTQAFLPLLEVSARDGAFLTLAFILIMACNGAFIAVISQAFRIRLLATEWLPLSFASSFANYFLPFKGGIGIRALYLSRIHGLPIAKFVSTLGVAYLMHTVINGLLAVIGLGISAITTGAPDTGLLVFFGAIAVAGIVAMLVDFDISQDHQRFPLAQLAAMLAAWRTIRGDRVLLLKLWLLTFALTLATIWQCRVAFDAIAVPLPWSGIMVYSASKNLATLISLTPGALGVVELISIYLGTVLDYSTANALSVQALIRAVAVIVLLLLGPVAFWILRRRIAAAGTPEHRETVT